MQRIPLHSSFIRSAGYDPKLKVLEIEFSHGSIHQYLQVEESSFKNLMDAKSPGKFYLKFIKNKYQMNRVGTTSQ